MYTGARGKDVRTPEHNLLSPKNPSCPDIATNDELKRDQKAHLLVSHEKKTITMVQNVSARGRGKKRKQKRHKDRRRRTAKIVGRKGKAPGRNKVVTRGRKTVVWSQTGGQRRK